MTSPTEQPTGNLEAHAPSERKPPRSTSPYGGFLSLIGGLAAFYGVLGIWSVWNIPVEWIGITGIILLFFLFVLVFAIGIVQLIAGLHLGRGRHPELLGLLATLASLLVWMVGLAIGGLWLGILGPIAIIAAALTIVGDLVVLVRSLSKESEA